MPGVGMHRSSTPASVSAPRVMPRSSGKGTRPAATSVMGRWRSWPTWISFRRPGSWSVAFPTRSVMRLPVLSGPWRSSNRSRLPEKAHRAGRAEQVSARPGSRTSLVTNGYSAPSLHASGSVSHSVALPTAHSQNPCSVSWPLSLAHQTLECTPAKLARILLFCIYG